MKKSKKFLASTATTAAAAAARIFTGEEIGEHLQTRQTTKEKNVGPMLYDITIGLGSV